MNAGAGDELEPGEIDIGHEHYIRYFSWEPDRKLNPQYADIPDVAKMGVQVRHRSLHPGNEPGKWCRSAAMFNLPVVAQVFPGHNVWNIEQEDPLTLSPSLLCLACGDHGFIREGKWIPA